MGVLLLAPTGTVGIDDITVAMVVIVIQTGAAGNQVWLHIAWTARNEIT